MMRFAAEAGKVMPDAEIIELHHDTKLDAPSGTAKATAERLPRRDADPLGAPARPRRAPGGDLRRAGQTLTIRHDTTSREAFVPGVLLALDQLRASRRA